jgi:hypothetical protein
MYFRKMICAVVATTFLFQQSLAATPPPESEDAPAPAEARMYPINESFVYRVVASQPPVFNPSPVPAQTGDEIIEVAYTVASGELYDVQLNLTRATAKILQGNTVVGYGVLTPSEVATLREAGQNIDKGTVAEAIIIGLIIVIVEIAATIAYSEWADSRDCQRGMIAGNNQIIRDIRHCQSQGRGFTIHDSTAADCGASAGATCN